MERSLNRNSVSTARRTRRKPMMALPVAEIDAMNVLAITLKLMGGVAGAKRVTACSSPHFVTEFPRSWAHSASRKGALAC
ncbi:MAG: hypothetical protein V4646_16020 [Pseudomonadota bacterium]